jgi:membrane fusion protein (multidrug efflux system)
MAPVREDTWQHELASVGTLSAVQGVTVSAQLDGLVVAIAFEPGARVKAGDLLVQQDVTAEEAQLRSAESAVQLAQINLKRSKELLAHNTIAQSQLDADQATYTQAVAQADAIRATIAKKSIRAAFAGRLGVRLVNLGQNLKAGDPIVSLQALDPIYADFFLPQQNVADVATGQDVEANCDAYPTRPGLGKITTINPDVDAATHNLRVQATLANADQRLRPGMYVDIKVLLPVREKVLAVPVTAVVYAPYGDSVFVVESHRDEATGQTTQIANQKLVRLGLKRGDFVAVLSGLNAGDVVVTAGAFKLRTGMPVTANNSLAPAAQLVPVPTDS